jgi:aryl-alcohol dehydrogenase-like predicted oxidoreductase
LENRILGLTNLKVSILGFGGAEIGFEKVSLKSVERLLGDALDAGINVVDTAECYLDSEYLIGKAISARRKDYHIFTKCGHSDENNIPDWTPNLIEKNIEDSLNRLKTDYLDLVQLHTCTADDLQKGDLIEVLIKSRNAGKVRYLGYSGDGDAALYAVKCGVFQTLQTSINIADQQSIDSILPLAVEERMGIIAKRPIANVAWKESKKSSDETIHIYSKRLSILDYDFLKDDLNKSIEIALRFTLSIPGVHTAVVGTSNSQHCLKNVKMIAAGRLPQNQFQSIRKQWSNISRGLWGGMN